MKRLVLAGLLLVTLTGLRTYVRADVPPVAESKKESVGAEVADVDPVPEDPSAHFNFTNFDWRGKDEWGGPFGDGKMVDTKTHETVDEEEPMSPPFAWMVLNFAIFIGILLKYLWPAGKQVAQERHDQIKSALDEAAKLRDEAAKKLADYETRIKDVDAEINKLVEGIRADAEADKQRILAAAAAQAAQMKRDAELRIAAEIELARAQLTREIAAVASTATEKMLREQANPDDQRKLVSTFVQGVGGSN